MTPSDREFGRLEQKVDDLGRRTEGIETSITHLREAASAEHAAMAGKIDAAVAELRVVIERRDHELDRELKERDRQISDLRDSRTEGRARQSLLKGAFGAAIALAGLLFANGGKLP